MMRYLPAVLLLPAAIASGSMYHYSREIISPSTERDNKDYKFKFAAIHRLSHCRKEICKDNISATHGKISIPLPEIAKSKKTSKVKNSESSKGRLEIILEKYNGQERIKYKRPSYDKSLLIFQSEDKIQKLWANTPVEWMQVKSDSRLMIVPTGLSFAFEALPQGEAVEGFFHSLIDQLSDTDLMVVLIEISDSKMQQDGNISYKKAYRYSRPKTGLALSIPYLSYPSSNKKEDPLIIGRGFMASRHAFLMPYLSNPKKKEIDSSLGLSLVGNYLTANHTSPNPLFLYFIPNTIGTREKRAECQPRTYSFVERVKQGDLLAISRRLVNDVAIFQKMNREEGMSICKQTFEAKLKDENMTIVFEIVQVDLRKFVLGLLPKTGKMLNPHAKTGEINLEDQNIVDNQDHSLLSSIQDNFAQLNISSINSASSTFNVDSPISEDLPPPILEDLSPPTPKKSIIKI